MSDLPGAVLFACTHNRTRSPMAQALMRRVLGDRVFVQSCGLKPGAPNEEPDPFFVAVMDELGLDVSGHRPKGFDDLEDDFDVVISLSPEAQHRAVELSRGRAVDLEFWPTLDPAMVEGSRETILEAYRRVRDGLEARIRGRFQARSIPGG